MPKNKGTFETSDLYLAALLKTAGMNFIGLTKNGSRGIFKFEDSSEREMLILDYFNGRAVQNIRVFVNHWMSFKKLVENI